MSYAEQSSAETEKQSEPSPLADMAMQALGVVMSVTEAAGDALGKVTGALGINANGSPSAKHFDPIIGVDIHLFPIGPTPIPLPAPYIAMVFDLFEYLAEAGRILSSLGGNLSSMLGGIATTLGGSVYVNGFHKGMASSEAKNFPHIPWFSPGPYNDGELFMGSATVLVEGEPFSYRALPNLDCMLIGGIAPIRVGKKLKTLSLVLPTSMILPLPNPKPVIVGGPPTISMASLAMKGLMKGIGTAGKKLKGAVKDWQKASDFWKKISKKCHDACDDIIKPGKFRDAVHDKICTLTGHPIDVISGYVTTGWQTDIELSGPLPFIWQRNYYSNSDYQGPLGHGWYHNYHYTLFDNGSEYLFIRLPDGRGVGTLRPKENEPSLMPDIRMQLCLSAVGNYYLQDYQGKQYHFLLEDFEHPHEGQHALGYITDTSKNTIFFKYNKNNTLTRIIDSTGRNITVDSDAYGRITALYLSGKKTEPLVRYEYEQHDLVRVFDAAGKPFDYLYQNHLLVKETNRNRTSFFFQWDDTTKGSSARAIATWGKSPDYPTPFYVRHLHYDDSLRQTVVIDGRKNKMVYYWHPSIPVVSKQVDPLGHHITFEYDSYHNRCVIIDEVGQKTQRQYDMANRLLQEEDASGQKTHYHYQDPDTNGLISDQVVKLERNTEIIQFQYNHYGLLTEISNSSGRHLGYHYHKNGLLSQIDDYEASITLARYEYSQAGLLSVHINENDQATHYHYDTLGRVIKISNGCYGDIQLSYDANNNIIERQHQSQNKEYFFYNAENQLIKHQDSAGDTTYWEFRGLPMKTRYIHADGHSISYEYDSEMNLTALINENKERYQLSYDEKERLISETGFDGHIIQYQYTPNDFLIRKRDGEQCWQQHVRDPLGRLKEIFWQDGQKAIFEYDSEDRLTQAKNNHHSTQFEYNNKHQLTACIQDGARVEYESTPNRQALTLPDGQVLAYHFGPQLKLSHIQFNDKTLSQYEYNEKGFEVKQSLGAMELLQQYDPYGRLIEQRGEQIDGTAYGSLTGRRYVYDKAGRITQIERQYGGHQRLVYDNRQRLRESHSSDFTHYYQYDAANNLLPDTQETNHPPVYTLHYRRGDDSGVNVPVVLHNQQTQNGDAHYQYDERGNRVLASYGHGAVKNHYIYDGHNQLVTVQKQTGNHTTQVVNFTYDALGRRCAKYVTPYRNNQPQSQYRVDYLWDGNVLLAEQTVEIKLGDSTPCPPNFLSPDVVYVHRPNSFEPLMQLRPPKDEDAFLPKRSFNVYYYLNDHLGTPQELFDKQGELVWQARTSPYGKLLKLGKAIIENPIRLPGQYEDKETGLYYNRFRYYHPDDGCYLNKDPIGLLGGFNLYDYPQNPITWFDPLGLNSTLLNKRLGGEIGDKLSAHHVIPVAVWDRNSAFLEEVGLSGRRDSVENGILIPGSEDAYKNGLGKGMNVYHSSKHDIYSAEVEEHLKSIENDYRTGILSKNDAKLAIQKEQMSLKRDIWSGNVPKDCKGRLN